MIFTAHCKPMTSLTSTLILRDPIFVNLCSVRSPRWVSKYHGIDAIRCFLPACRNLTPTWDTYERCPRLVRFIVISAHPNRADAIHKNWDTNGGRGLGIRSCLYSSSQNYHTAGTIRGGLTLRRATSEPSMVGIGGGLLAPLDHK